MKPLLIASILTLISLNNVHAQTDRLDSLLKSSQDKLSTGDVAGATGTLMTAQHMAEQGNNLSALCKIQLMLGKAAIISENAEAAEQAFQKGSQYCGACQDTLRLGKLLMQKGVLSLKLKQIDTAIQLFKQSAQFYKIGKDTTGAANALAKVGNALELQGKYKEAKPYYEELYRVTQKDTGSTAFMNANIYLTGNCLYLDEIQEALRHNKVVMELSRKLNANYEYAASLRYDALIYQKMGQDAKAFEKLDHYATYYQDTLLNKIQLDQAEEMKAKYEAEKKETLIALQETQLGRERFKFWVLIGGLLGALAAGGLLYRLTRQLRKRNEEKEFLIKEIHHRVKNNLQILSSLLHLQSRQIKDDSALSAVREGQNRVDAMGLIHQKLYMGDHVARVEMKDYLEQFGQNILDSFGMDEEHVKIEYLLDPLYLDVDTAIPLGLIINELVTNSLKYAFPAGSGAQQGHIQIALWKDGKGHLCLKVSDNGVGQAAAPELKGSTSFGTNLVQMLSKKLKGKLEILPVTQGYATLIVFDA